MKETRIKAPKGCEVEKVEIVDGVAVVTFKEKERKLPKSWEEFCEMYPVKAGESYISQSSAIANHGRTKREILADRNITPDHATAEAVLALCQLIQLRDAFNGDWVPDWKDDSKKYVLEFVDGKISSESRYCTSSSPLYFKTIEMRDEFLRCFRPLIEKIKPLYGIKEGGEK